MSRFIKKEYWPANSTFDSKMCEAWAERNGLVQVRGGHVWFVRFLGKTCVCMSGGECDVLDEEALGLHDHPNFDHISDWEDKNEKQVLVVQPYSISTAEMREWVEWADRHGLGVRISGESFYYPRRTLMIEITRRNNE